MIYIYRIWNWLNDKEYVGQTKCVKTRWARHLSKSGLKASPLYDDLELYGREAFVFEILQTVETRAEADQAEYLEIGCRGCLFPKGYNKGPGGGVRAATYGAKKWRAGHPGKMAEFAKAGGIASVERRKQSEKAYAAWYSAATAALRKAAERRGAEVAARSQEEVLAREERVADRRRKREVERYATDIEFRNSKLARNAEWYSLKGGYAGMSEDRKEKLRNRARERYRKIMQDPIAHEREKEKMRAWYAARRMAK